MPVRATVGRGRIAGIAYVIGTDVQSESGRIIDLDVVDRRVFFRLVVENPSATGEAMTVDGESPNGNTEVRARRAGPHLQDRRIGKTGCMNDGVIAGRRTGWSTGADAFEC